jgi:peptidyl-prolyl cis-trans isomerase SurA
LAGPAALVAVLAVTGCAPIKAGAAATVGDQRITTSELDAGVNRLIDDVHRAGQQASPSAELTRFVLADQVTGRVSELAARQLGISVTTTQVDALERQVEANPTTVLESVYTEAASQGHGQDLREYARIAALRQMIADRVDPGDNGTDEAAKTARAQKLNTYLAGVSDQVKVSINPRYGGWSAKDMLVTAKSDPFVKAAPTPQSAVS